MELQISKSSLRCLKSQVLIISISHIGYIRNKKLIIICIQKVHDEVAFQNTAKPVEYLICFFPIIKTWKHKSREQR